MGLRAPPSNMPAIATEGTLEPGDLTIATSMSLTRKLESVLTTIDQSLQTQVCPVYSDTPAGASLILEVETLDDSQAEIFVAISLPNLLFGSDSDERAILEMITFRPLKHRLCQVILGTDERYPIDKDALSLGAIVPISRSYEESWIIQLSQANSAFHYETTLLKEPLTEKTAYWTLQKKPPVSTQLSIYYPFELHASQYEQRPSEWNTFLSKILVPNTVLDVGTSDRLLGRGKLIPFGDGFAIKVFQLF